MKSASTSCVSAFVAAALAACSPSATSNIKYQPDGTPAILKPAVTPDGRVEIESVRRMVRAQARLLYGADCNEIIIPDRAFVPIEINGDSRSEYAVLFGRSLCKDPEGMPGGSANIWLGTGGANVQIWLATGQPHLLLEHSMHGFSPAPGGLQSLQHGGFCPGGAGPGMCLVKYDWNDRDRALEVTHRRLYEYQHPGSPPRMTYEYQEISR